MALVKYRSPISKSPVKKVMPPKVGAPKIAITKQVARPTLTQKATGAKVTARPVATQTKPKGLITAKTKGLVSSALKAGALIPGVGGIVSGIAGNLVSSYKARPDGSVYLHRRRKRGLTHRDIQGAVRLLKLVKRFAPAGHKTALRMHRHKSY